MDRVCHFEVPYENKDRAWKFYSDVFGWQLSDAPTPEPYSFAITTDVDPETHMPTQVGGINGGMYQRGEQGATSPVIVMEVDNCEQRIKDVVAAGGEAIMGPHEISGMGIYGQVKDTECNIVGLWQTLRS